MNDDGLKANDMATPIKDESCVICVIIITFVGLVKHPGSPFMSTMNLYIKSLFLNILAYLLIPTLSGMIILTT